MVEESELMLVDCYDDQDVLIAALVPATAGVPQEWVYLCDGQAAPSGVLFHRRWRPPAVEGDRWEFYQQHPAR